MCDFKPHEQMVSQEQEVSLKVCSPIPDEKAATEDKELRSTSISEEQHDEAEYYNFLREYAGSFDAASEEDDEDGESEHDISADESVDEEIESPASSTSWSRSRRGDQPPRSHDKRGPVQDEYDVAKAVQHYAMHHPRDRMRRQRETLQEAIRLREEQAKRLSGLAGCPHLKHQLAAHYGKISSELSQEAQILESKLVAFNKACELWRDQQAKIEMPMYQAVAVQ